MAKFVHLRQPQVSMPGQLALTSGLDSLALPAVKTSGKTKRRSVMLGVGLDSDGHKRLTVGPNFALVGGTSETHEVMTEKVVKINEKLSTHGKTLDTVSAEEFEDVAHEVGLKRWEAKPRE